MEQRLFLSVLVLMLIAVIHQFQIEIGVSGIYIRNEEQKADAAGQKAEQIKGHEADFQIKAARLAALHDPAAETHTFDRRELRKIQQYEETLRIHQA